MDRLASDDSIPGVGSTCLPWGKGSDCWSGPQRSGVRLSAHDRHPRPAARRTARRRSTSRRSGRARGGGRPDPRARGHGPNRRRGLLVTGEPGVGKTVLLDAASKAASAAGTRILRAAGIQFEAGMSFSGPNQVLLPLLGEVSKLPAVHRGASTRMRSRTLAPSSGKRASRSAAAASSSSRWTSSCGTPHDRSGPPHPSAMRRGGPRGCRRGAARRSSGRPRWRGPTRAGRQE